MKDEDQLIYEAYVNSLMQEAPISMSGDYSASDPAREKASQYNLSDQGLDLIIQHVKSMFPQEGDGYGALNLEDELGTLNKKKVSMWLREKIKDFTTPRAKETDESGNLIFPNAAKHTYFSRVVANDMLDDSEGEPFINIDATGSVTVDTDQEEEVKSDIKADIAKGDDGAEPTDEPTTDTGPVKFDRRTVYDVDPLAADTLPKRHRDVAEYVVDYEGETGQEIIDGMKQKMIFNNPEIAGGFDGSEGRLIKVLNDLITAGVMTPTKQSDDDSDNDEASMIDMSDEDEVARADRDYIDRMVRQSEFGAQTPTYGLDD